MDRRTFIEFAVGGAVTAGVGSPAAGPLPSRSEAVTAGGRSGEVQSAPSIRTVTGAIVPDDLGFVLPHEHVMSRFGPPPDPTPSCAADRIERVVLPYLRYIRDLGVGTICECTAAYFGRDPGILRELSERSGRTVSHRRLTSRGSQRTPLL